MHVHCTVYLNRQVVNKADMSAVQYFKSQPMSHYIHDKNIKCNRLFQILIPTSWYCKILKILNELNSLPAFSHYAPRPMTKVHYRAQALFYWHLTRSQHIILMHIYECIKEMCNDIILRSSHHHHHHHHHQTKSHGMTEQRRKR